MIESVATRGADRIRRLLVTTSAIVFAASVVAVPPVPGPGGRLAPGAGLADATATLGSVDGLVFYRFVSPVARTLSQARLRRHVITRARPVVLVGRAAHVTSAPARG